jgi:AraC-like DNA-binding protein
MTNPRQTHPPATTAQLSLPPTRSNFHYLPVSETLRAWGIYLTSAGQSTYQPRQKYPQQGHPKAYNFNWASGRILAEYAVVLITAGTGEYEFRNYAPGQCRRGDVLLVAPGQWHRYRPLPNTGWTELWICLGGEYLHRLRDKGLAFGKPCVSLGTHFTPVRLALLSLVDEVNRKADYNSILFTSKALNVIALIAEAGGIAPAQSKGIYHFSNPQVARAIEFIWSNSHRHLSIGDVAQAVGLVARTLERRFADCHERGIREEIEWSRYSRARRLLEDENLPIKDIAYSCGFGDPRRMIEVFRKLTSATPTEIRERRNNAIQE